MLLQIVLLLQFIGLRRCRTVKAKKLSLLGCFDLFLFTWLCQWKAIISMFICFGKMRGWLKSADCRRRLKWRLVWKLREREPCLYAYTELHKHRVGLVGARDRCVQLYQWVDSKVREKSHFCSPWRYGGFCKYFSVPFTKTQIEKSIVLREQSKDKSIGNELQKVCSDWWVWQFQSSEDCRVSLFWCLVGLLCSCVHPVSNIQFLVWQQRCKPSWGGDKKK